MGLLVLALLLAVATVAAAQSGPVVVVNSKDWHDKYLGAMYADQIHADLIYFNNLGDAQIKTQTIDPHRRIIAFESDNPVVKNYKSVLQTNGFTNYTVFTYSDYHELQMKLFNGTYKQLVVLDPQFGPEAIAYAPAIGGKHLRPFFLDSTDTGDLKTAEKSAGSIVIAGHFPVRLIAGIHAVKRYTGLSPQNADAITEAIAANSSSQWGIIMRIDRVDFVSLTENIPIVVYTGSLSDTINVVKQTNITKFEVISADAANLAQQIKDGSGEDLALMLKYGRTITNLPGLTGKILDLDTALVDYPSPDLEIVSAKYYPSANALLVTYKNRGNVPTLFLTNIQFASNALSDAHLRVVPPGETVEEPYPLTSPANATDAFINARYDMSLPLTHTVLSSQGTELVQEPVTDSTAHNITLTLGKVTYNDAKGELDVEVHTDQPGVARIEVPIGDNLTFTSGGAENVSGDHIFQIETPYHTAATFSKPITIDVYQGDTAPVYSQSFTATPELTGNHLTGSVTAIASGVLIAILLALIIGLVVFVRSRRRQEL